MADENRSTDSGLQHDGDDVSNADGDNDPENRRQNCHNANREYYGRLYHPNSAVGEIVFLSNGRYPDDWQIGFSGQLDLRLSFRALLPYIRNCLMTRVLESDRISEYFSGSDWMSSTEEQDLIHIEAYLQRAARDLRTSGERVDNEAIQDPQNSAENLESSYRAVPKSSTASRDSESSADPTVSSNPITLTISENLQVRLNPEVLPKPEISPQQSVVSICSQDSFQTAVSVLSDSNSESCAVNSNISVNADDTILPTAQSPNERRLADSTERYYVSLLTDLMVSESESGSEHSADL